MHQTFLWIQPFSESHKSPETHPQESQLPVLHVSVAASTCLEPPLDASACWLHTLEFLTTLVHFLPALVHQYVVCHDYTITSGLFVYVMPPKSVYRNRLLMPTGWHVTHAVGWHHLGRAIWLFWGVACLVVFADEGRYESPPLSFWDSSFPHCWG